MTVIACLYRLQAQQNVTHSFPLLLGCEPAADAVVSGNGLLENGKGDSTAHDGEAVEEAGADTKEDAAENETAAKKKKKRSKGTL